MRGVMRESLFNGTALAGKDEKVLETDDIDDCPTVQMYLIAQNYTLKNGWSDKIYVIYILP